MTANADRLLGRQVAAFVRRLPNVDIVGGCCGTWDAHLSAIAEEVDRSN